MRNFDYEVEQILDSRMNEHFNDMFEEYELNYDLIGSMHDEDFIQESDELSEDFLKEYFMEQLRIKYINKYADILVKQHDGLEITDNERQWIFRYEFYFSKFDNETRKNWVR